MWPLCPSCKGFYISEYQNVSVVIEGSLEKVAQHLELIANPYERRHQAQCSLDNLSRIQEIINSYIQKSIIYSNMNETVLCNRNKIEIFLKITFDRVEFRNVSSIAAQLGHFSLATKVFTYKSIKTIDSFLKMIIFIIYTGKLCQWRPHISRTHTCMGKSTLKHR